MLSALALGACSNDSFVGDAPRNWADSTNTFIPTEENAYSTYYKPGNGTVGDPMPFYDKKSGDFKVFYLQEYALNHDKRFHPIWGLSTTDGCNYKPLGEILAVGASDYQQDAALGTGCCYYNEKEDLYYFYYTGHNGNCDSREVVMRATSKDLKTWTRDNLWSLKGDSNGLSKQDFRDPQIFEDGGVYHMVISTYPNATSEGNPVFAEYTSKDMKNWEFAGKFNMIWDRMCECPDIFKMGNYWYLVYSEAFKSDWSRKVKYMMADSWENLKRCFADPGAGWSKLPNEGVIETRAFYAGKTASNGTDRYIWGWSPYRTGKDIHEKNLNVGNGKEGQKAEPEWSGALVCHKLVQDKDGFLSVAEVPAMAAKYNKETNVIIKDSKNYNNGKISGDGYVVFNSLGYHNHISFTLKAGSIDAFGVSFVRGSNADRWYTLRCHTEWYGAKGKDYRRVNLEQQGTAEDVKWKVFGAEGYLFPIPEDNTYNVDIYTDNSVVVMYINGNYGTTQRIYGIQHNCWSIDCFGGNYEISNVKVSQY